MKQINLYQAEFRPPKVVLPARLLIFSGALFLLLMLGLYGWGSWQLKHLQAEVVQAEQRAQAVSRQLAASLAETRQKDPGLALEAQSLEAQLRALKLAQDAIASGELGSDAGYSAYFRALANTVRPGAWLTKVTISDSGRAMDLQGHALTGTDSARLIASLRSAPLFVGLSFSGLEVGPPDVAASKSAAREENQTDVVAKFLAFSLNARLPEPLAAGTSTITPRSQP